MTVVKREKIVYANGSTYEGDIKDGLKCGFGKLVTKNGDSFFEGNWNKDLPEGSGVLINDDGQFNGEFSKGELCGHGNAKYNDESLYQGEFKKSVPHGSGTLVWPDNDVYEGEFVNGEAHGHGIYSCSDGTYKGDWLSGCMTGYGTFTYNSGTVFTGNWVDDKKEGIGNFEFFNGCKFKGNFANNKADGYGTFEAPNGFVLAGEWKEGVLKDLVNVDSLDNQIFSDSMTSVESIDNLDSDKPVSPCWKPRGVLDWGNYRFVPDLEILEKLEPSIFSRPPLTIAGASGLNDRSNTSDLIDLTPAALTKSTEEDTPRPVSSEKISPIKDKNKQAGTSGSSDIIESTPSAIAKSTKSERTSPSSHKKIGLTKDPTKSEDLNTSLLNIEQNKKKSATLSKENYAQQPPTKVNDKTLTVKKDTATQSSILTSTVASTASPRPLYAPVKPMTHASWITGTPTYPVEYCTGQMYPVSTSFRELPSLEKEVYLREVHEKVTIKEVSVPQYRDKGVPVMHDVYVEEDTQRLIPVPVEQSTTVILRLPKIRRKLESWKFPVYVPRLVEYPFPAEYLTPDQIVKFSSIAADVECDSNAGLLGQSLAIYGEIFEALGKELPNPRNLDMALVANNLISKEIKNFATLKNRR